MGLPQEETDQERREAIAAAFTMQSRAIISSIRDDLQAIDSGIDVVLQTYDESTIFQHGKAYADRSGDTYNTAGAALMPSYSSHHILYVRWTGATGGIPDPNLRAEVERYLNRVLPSWMDYSISNGSGFYLNGFNYSYLGLTAF